MRLTESQITILQRLNENLEYGDINTIAESTGKHRVYVGNVLNPFLPAYNDDIVKAATKLISEREQSRKALLGKLPANCGEEGARPE